MARTIRVTRVGCIFVVCWACGSPAGSHTSNVESPTNIESPEHPSQQPEQPGEQPGEEPGEPDEEVVFTPAPVPTPAGIVDAECERQRFAAIDSSVAPSAHGPRVTTAGGVFATFFIEDSKMHMATYAPDGSLTAPPEVALPIEAQRSGLEIADLGEVECAALTTIGWHSTRDRELMLARWCPARGFAPELSLRRSPMIESPAVAAGHDGKIALAWFEQTQLHFALVDGQRVVEESVLAENIQPEGTPAIVAAGAHYLVFFTRTSLAHSGGLLVARADENGQPIAHGEIMRNPGGALYGLQAARRGNEIGLAFNHGRDLAFLRADLEGHRRGDPVLLKRWRGNEGIGAGYRASSIVANAHGWWIGATRTEVRRNGDDYHYQSALFFTDGTGVTRPTNVGRGSLGLSLAAHGDGVLGAYLLEPWTGRDRVPAMQQCDRPRRTPAQRLAAPAAVGACDQAIHAMPIDRFAPVREVFDVIGIGDGGDLIVADLRREGGLRLSRMTRDGRVRWSRPVALPPAHHPSLALRGDEIGLVFGQEDENYVATFALDGTPRVEPRRLRILDRSSPCIAASSSGYAVVGSRLDGNSTFVALDASLDPGATASLGTGMRCALASAQAGWLWAPTRPGARSGTNHLVTQRLDPRGRAIGGETTLVGGNDFARSPKLLRLRSGYQLLWTDPLYSRPRATFRSTRLTIAGAPTGDIQEYGFAADIGGYGLIPDGEHARLVFANHRSYVEHRLCPDHPGPYAPPHIHERHMRH